MLTSLLVQPIPGLLFVLSSFYILHSYGIDTQSAFYLQKNNFDLFSSVLLLGIPQGVLTEISYHKTSPKSIIALCIRYILLLCFLLPLTLYSIDSIRRLPATLVPFLALLPGLFVVVTGFFRPFLLYHRHKYLFDISTILPSSFFIVSFLLSLGTHDFLDFSVIRVASIYSILVVITICIFLVSAFSPASNLKFFLAKHNIRFPDLLRLSWLPDDSPSALLLRLVVNSFLPFLQSISGLLLVKVIYVYAFRFGSTNGVSIIGNALTLFITLISPIGYIAPRIQVKFAAKDFDFAVIERFSFFSRALASVFGFFSRICKSFIISTFLVIALILFTFEIPQNQAWSQVYLIAVITILSIAPYVSRQLTSLRLIASGAILTAFLIEVSRLAIFLIFSSMLLLPFFASYPYTRVMLLGASFLLAEIFSSGIARKVLLAR